MRIFWPFLFLFICIWRLPFYLKDNFFLVSIFLLCLDLNGETTLQKCDVCLESIEKSREMARQVNCEVNTIDKLERLLQMSPLDLSSENNHKNAICVNAENIYVVKLLEKLMDLCISAGRLERALEIAIHLTRSYELVKFFYYSS